jgi:hypothetical protein
MQKDLILKEFEDLKKAVNLLKASIERFKVYKVGKIYTPNELEYYDSLSFRFEKSIELFLNFFKGLEIFLNLNISDTLRDRLLNIQKINLIDDIDFWIESRLLRNKIAHTYLPEKIKDMYDEIHTKSKKIFKYLNHIEKYLESIKGNE